jgi:hypothetical protein
VLGGRTQPWNKGRDTENDVLKLVREAAKNAARNAPHGDEDGPRIGAGRRGRGFGTRGPGAYFW